VGLTRARKLLTLTYARRRMLFGQGGNGIPSRFLGEIPADLVERHSTAPAMGWGSGAGGPGSGSGSFGSSPLGGGSNAGFVAVPDKHPALELTVGDDVVHASFGEGVVTAVEPGNVVVIRFRNGGADRKLMADYAPIQKAAS
jgi:DNA helicase-2/ATP-dependent DNA helicase PcrA